MHHPLPASSRTALLGRVAAPRGGGSADGRASMPGRHRPGFGVEDRATNGIRPMLRAGLAVAALLALGLGGEARAQDRGPRLIGGGEEARIVYPDPSRNIVGGGTALLTGGGDNLRITYGPQVTVGDPPNLVAEMTGGGDDRQIAYRPVGPSGSMIAARGAPSAR